MCCFLVRTALYHTPQWLKSWVVERQYILLKCSVGFFHCSYISFCWSQKFLALCFLTALCNSVSGSCTPEGRVRDGGLEKAYPWVSLQPDVHAGLYLGRLRCCLRLSVCVSLSVSLPVCLSEVWAGEPTELHTQLSSKCLWMLRDLMGCDGNQQNPQEHLP